MFDYNYIKTSDAEAVISRLTWPVWKLVTGRSDRAEWAIAEKPEDPVRFAEQVFLAAKEKGDTLKSVTIVECDNNYIESMVQNGKVVKNGIGARGLTNAAHRLIDDILFETGEVPERV